MIETFNFDIHFVKKHSSNLKLILGIVYLQPLIPIALLATLTFTLMSSGWQGFFERGIAIWLDFYHSAGFCRDDYLWENTQQLVIERFLYFPLRNASLDGAR